MIELRPDYQKKMERRFDLKRRALELLNQINAEFKSDPMSVQCFDLRLVKEVDEVITELNAGSDF